MKFSYYAVLLFLAAIISIESKAQCNASLSVSPSQQGNQISAAVQIVNPGNGVYVYQWYFDGTVIQPYSFVNHASATLQFSYPQTLCVSVYDTIHHCYYDWCDTFYPNACTLNTTVGANYGLNGRVYIGVAATGQHGALSNNWVVDGHSILPINFGNYDSIYLSNGSHQLCVFSHDTALCYDTACMTLNVTNCGLSVSMHDSLIPGTSQHYLWPHLNTTAGTNSYSWSDGSSQDILVTSNPGVYCVTITNSNSPCKAEACVTITSCAFQASIHDSLIGPYTHLLSVNTTSTSGTNTFHWNNGATTSQITAVTSGNYCVTVSNSLGCTANTCKVVNPCSLHSGIRDSLIPGTTTHLLTLTNGSGNYNNLNVVWSNQSSQPVITVTAPGTYCVWIRDTITNCRDSFCLNVANCAFQLSIKDSIQTASSHLLLPNFSISGGVNTYHWSNGSTAPEIFATTSGLYCLTVTNSLGCSATACVSVTLCNLQISITDTVVPGSNNHYLVSHPSPSGNYTYLWSPGASTSPNLLVSSSGTYCVTVNWSGSNCTASTCKSVTVSGCNADFNYTAACDSVRFNAVDADSFGVWIFGDGAYASGVKAVHHYAPGTYFVTHYVNHSNPVFCTDTVHKTIVVPACATDTICGKVFYDANGNGIQDNNEQSASGITIHAGSYTTTTFLGSYVFIVPSGIYQVWMTAPSGTVFTLPANSGAATASYTVAVNGHSRHCGYNFGLSNAAAHVVGYVFIDYNNNNIRDAGDSYVSGVNVHVGAYHSNTNFFGYYYTTVPAGSYNVSYTPSGAYAGYTSSPVSQNVSVAAGGTVRVDFALHVPAGSCNASVDIVPHTTVTAAHPAWYNVYIHNYGSSAISGTMLFAYDPVLHLNYAQPAAVSNNVAQHLLTFNYSNIPAGQYASYWISFQADSVIPVGYPAFNLATITANCNESNMADNTDTVHQVATSSWDPNNKIVTPEGKGVEGFISKTQELQYVINFQNTGTAPAVNVVLHDSISANLDLNTLRVVGASHDYVLQLNGRELVATFSDILLPDSGSNEPASHGWLAFRIRPINGIAGGSVIDNRADIYFDYNEGVNTNSVRNTIEIALGLEETTNAPDIILAPNPFESFTNLKVFGVGEAPLEVVVTDLCGRVVLHESGLPAEAIRLERNGISAGTYLYQIEQNGRVIAVGKMMAK